MRAAGGAAGYKYMRGETLERLRRRATREWIPALGRGVVGAADGWTRGRRLLSTARDTRDEEFRDAGMRFLTPKTSWARTLTSTRLLFHLTANTAASGQNHVSHLHAADEQRNCPQRWEGQTLALSRLQTAYAISLVQISRGTHSPAPARPSATRPH